MENNSILYKIKSKYCLEEIFSYINDNFKFKLLSYSKVLQKKYGIGINDYKIKYRENFIKLKNTKEFLGKIQKYDKLNLIKNNPKFFFWLIQLIIFLIQFLIIGMIFILMEEYYLNEKN